MLRLARRSVGPRARNSSRVSEVGGLVHWLTESTILPGMMCSHWPVMPERTCTDTTSRPHLNNNPYALQPMPYSLGPSWHSAFLGYLTPTALHSPILPWYAYLGNYSLGPDLHSSLGNLRLLPMPWDLTLRHTASARIWTNLASLPLPYERNLPSDRTLPDFTSVETSAS
jgi:hypothetical protein